MSSDTPTVYRYTQNGNYLTEAQRQFYEQNGYIIIRNLVSHEALDEYRTRYNELCTGKVDSSGMILVKSSTRPDARGPNLIVKIQDFLYDEVLFKHACDEAIVNVVSSIIGEDLTAAHSVVVNKPPHTRDNSERTFFQDLHYFPFRPADRICAALTAMDNIDERAGCPFAVAGSHRGHLYEHVFPGSTKKIKNFENVPRVHLELEKGDTIFFHPMLLHGAGPNMSEAFKRDVTIHYANTNCDFVNVRSANEEYIAHEIEVLAYKRGYSMSYKDVWKYKCRLLNGAAPIY